MLRGGLQNMKQNDMPANRFISKMKGFASELAKTGKKVDYDEMKGYILNGLDSDYNPLIDSINSISSTTLTNMCAQLAAFDYHP
jgi:hypothetical protein